jgi:predicted  nucleic acid-binding Zn-ribbon protein
MGSRKQRLSQLREEGTQLEERSQAFRKKIETLRPPHYEVMGKLQDVEKRFEAAMKDIHTRMRQVDCKYHHKRYEIEAAWSPILIAQNVRLNN